MHFQQPTSKVVFGDDRRLLPLAGGGDLCDTAGMSPKFIRRLLGPLLLTVMAAAWSTASVVGSQLLSQP